MNANEMTKVVIVSQDGVHTAANTLYNNVSVLYTFESMLDDGDAKNILHQFIVAAYTQLGSIACTMTTQANVINALQDDDYTSLEAFIMDHKNDETLFPHPSQFIPDEVILELAQDDPTYRDAANRITRYGGMEDNGEAEENYQTQVKLPENIESILARLLNVDEGRISMLSDQDDEELAFNDDDYDDAESIMEAIEDDFLENEEESMSDFNLSDYDDLDTDK